MDEYDILAKSIYGAYKTICRCSDAISAIISIERGLVSHSTIHVLCKIHKTTGFRQETVTCKLIDGALTLVGRDYEGSPMHLLSFAKDIYDANNKHVERSKLAYALQMGS